MATIPTTYTGMNSGAAPIYQGSKALSASQQGAERLLQAQRSKVGQQQKEAEQLMQNIQVDPVQVAAENVMTEQANKIDEFTDKWAGLMQEKQGDLSMQDKAKMATDKQDLAAWQGNYQAQYQQYLQQTEQFDERYHDKDAFVQRSAEYIATGKMPPGGLLEVAPMDYATSMGILQDRARSREWNEDYVPSNDGKSYSLVTTSPWKEDEAKKDFELTMMNNDAMMRGYETRFRKSGKKEVYLQKADMDNDGVYSPTEKKNAIIEYAWNEEGRKAYFGKSRTERRMPGVGGRSKEPDTEVSIDVAKDGYKEKNAQYWFKPTKDKDGYVLGYGTSLQENERGFEVPSNAIDQYLPEGAANQDGVIFIKPNIVSKSGDEVKAYVPVYERSDIVTSRRRKRQLNKLFKEEGSNIVVDGTDSNGVRRYIKEGDSIYRLSDDVKEKEIEMPLPPVYDYIVPYFPKLSSVFGEKAAEPVNNSPELDEDFIRSIGGNIR